MKSLGMVRLKSEVWAGPEGWLGRWEGWRRAEGRAVGQMEGHGTQTQQRKQGGQPHQPGASAARTAAPCSVTWSGQDRAAARLLADLASLQEEGAGSVACSPQPSPTSLPSQRQLAQLPAGPSNSSPVLVLLAPERGSWRATRVRGENLG